MRKSSGTKTGRWATGPRAGEGGISRRARERITELENPAAASLDRKSTLEILRIINREDRIVALAVGKVLPQIARAVDLVVRGIANGGRLVYLGAGTSGRLGILDAAECIPTFGTDRVVGVMAGAPKAMFRPTEVSEDDPRLAVRDLRRVKFSRRDVLVGISASGRTPYVLGGIRYGRKLGAPTIGLTSNPASPLRRLADLAIVPVVGPEVIAGSTRMKAGTAAKLVLNMISTAAMTRLGRVLSGWMINLQLRNKKLWQRGRRILMKAAGTSAGRAARALRLGRMSLPTALLILLKRMNPSAAERQLRRSGNMARALREAWAESPVKLRGKRRGQVAAHARSR